MITNALLKVYKLEGKVRVISTTNTGEAINSIKSDTVDAVMLPASARTSYVTQLCRDGKIKFLYIPDDKIKAMRALLPRSISSITLPAKTYPGQDQALPTFGVRSIFVAAARLPADTVYTVTKTMFENIGEFQKFHPTAKEWTLQETINDPVIPFHPGAVRYFKEKKLWTPALEKEQEELKH
jgi:TRAP transporter TAXI family solute receptor